MRRVAEIQKLVEKGKDEKAQETMEKYEKHLEKFSEKINKLADKKSDKADELMEKFEQSQIKQQSVLADVYEKVPEEAKAGILTAIENSSKGMESALEKLQSQGELDNYMERVETRLETEFKNAGEDIKNTLMNRVEVRKGSNAGGNGNQPGTAGSN